MAQSTSESASVVPLTTLLAAVRASSTAQKHRLDATQKQELAEYFQTRGGRLHDTQILTPLPKRNSNFSDDDEWIPDVNEDAYGICAQNNDGPSHGTRLQQLPIIDTESSSDEEASDAIFSATLARSTPAVAPPQVQTIRIGSTFMCSGEQYVLQDDFTLLRVPTVARLPTNTEPTLPLSIRSGVSTEEVARVLGETATKDAPRINALDMIPSPNSSPRMRLVLAACVWYFNRKRRLQQSVTTSGLNEIITDALRDNVSYSLDVFTVRTMPHASYVTKVLDLYTLPRCVQVRQLATIEAALHAHGH